MSSRQVRVRAPSRLHFGLLSFGASGGRQFGGVGVMVDRPGLVLRASRAAELSADGPLAERAMRVARELIQNRASAVDRSSSTGEVACHIQIESAPPEHVGLGTGTQLALAVAAALSALAEDTPATSVCDADAIAWARLAGRGERSAIGTHGFARGGLLVEGGKRAADAVSPLISRIELPAKWRFVLLLDSSQRGLSGPQERRAFAELPQVSPDATAQLCREVLVELLPAAAEGDFDAFAESVYRYGRESGLLFSRQQGGAFAAGLPTELTLWLRNREIRGAGQSSWGPTVFALTRSADEAKALVADVQRHFSTADLTAIIAAADNRGAQIELL